MATIILCIYFSIVYPSLSFSAILTASIEQLEKLLRWHNLQVDYGHEPIVQLQRLELVANGWNCIIGVSGCGKSTLLKALAGLLPARCDSAPQLRSLLLCQEDSLLPWLNVEDNVLIGARLRGEAVSQKLRHQAHSCLQQVGLSEVKNSWPATLSGGMRARVALARTLMEDADLLLLDEPFAALDAVTKSKMQTLAFELLRGRSVLLVTHDPLEALRLGHSVQLLQKNSQHTQQLRLPQQQPLRDFDAASMSSCYQQAIEALNS